MKCAEEFRPTVGRFNKNRRPGLRNMKNTEGEGGPAIGLKEDRWGGPTSWNCAPWFPVPANGGQARRGATRVRQFKKKPKEGAMNASEVLKHSQGQKESPSLTDGDKREPNAQNPHTHKNEQKSK